MRIRATAKETYTGYHQIFLKRPAQLLTGLIALRAISAQARFAPQEVLFASLSLRAALHYVRYSAALRSYSGFVEMTGPGNFQPFIARYFRS